MFLSVAVLLIAGCNNAQNKGKLDDYSKLSVMTSDTVFTFDNCKPGSIPEGWSEHFTGNGKTHWQVEDDGGNKVLAQMASSNPNYHFNEIVYDGFKVKDVDMSVRLKGIKGNNDQGGGLIWRYMGEGNYYVVRANPLEDNVVLYKVVNGRRTDLPLLGKGKTYGMDVSPLGHGWNTLRVVVKGDIFTVYLNGKELYEVKDGIFENAGKVGLWTKSDAVTYFDDFEVERVKEVSR